METPARGLRILFLLLATLVVATGQPPEAFAAPADPENLRALTPVLEAHLKDWLAAWRIVQPRLRVEQFKKNRTGTIGSPWRALTMQISQDHPGFPVFIFSPDRRWFVDVLSGLAMSREGGHVAVGPQPDSWVWLVDRETSRIREILMTGTAGGFHDAVWLSNHSFVVAGYSEGLPKQGCSGGYTWAPWLYLVNIPRDSLTAYRGPDSCQGARDYGIKKIEQKIPNVRF